MQPPRVFHDPVPAELSTIPSSIPLKAMEDAAYEGVEETAEEEGSKRCNYGDYAHLGPAIAEPSYRPGVLREWPRHTDFRLDELQQHELGRWD